MKFVSDKFLILNELPWLSMTIIFQFSYHRRQQQNPVNAIKSYEL